MIIWLTAALSFSQFSSCLLVSASSSSSSCLASSSCRRASSEILSSVSVCASSRLVCSCATFSLANSVWVCSSCCLVCANSYNVQKFVAVVRLVRWFMWLVINRTTKLPIKINFFGFLIYIYKSYVSWASVVLPTNYIVLTSVHFVSDNEEWSETFNGRWTTWKVSTDNLQRRVFCSVIRGYPSQPGRTAEQLGVQRSLVVPG